MIVVCIEETMKGNRMYKKSSGQGTAIIVGVIVLSMTIASVVGYLLNLSALINNADFKQPYKTEVIRTLGVIIPPLGGIIGYMTLEEEIKNEHQ